MKKSRLFGLGLATIALIGIIVILGIYGFRQWGDDKEMTAGVIRDKVVEQYSGEVTEVQKLDDYYLVNLMREAGEYELKVSAEDGRILKMSQVEKIPADEKEPAEEKKEEPFTEQQAVDVALERVSGTVDDVDHESTGDGDYFLVEIEREDGSEATVQVHAITGEIMSVSWDD